MPKKRPEDDVPEWARNIPLDLFVDVQHRLGVSGDVLAWALNIDPGTLYRWRSHTTQPSLFGAAVATQLLLLARSRLFDLGQQLIKAHQKRNLTKPGAQTVGMYLLLEAIPHTRRTTQ